MDLIELGRILKEKREELGLSLRQAGDKIGVSHNYLSILEKANDPRSNAPIKPTIDTLKLISDFYKLNINELLRLSGYDIEIKPKQVYSSDELIDIIPNEFKDLFEEQNIPYVKFAKQMMLEEINPDDLVELLKISQKLREKFKSDKKL